MHQVEHKLKYEIVPYLLTADRLRTWRPLRIYTFYVYFGEVFVLLAGFGLANPIMTFLTNGSVNNVTQASDKLTVIHFLGSGYAALVGICLLLGWGVLKFYVRREELEKRCNLLKSCILQCAQFNAKLHRAVAEEEPMGELKEIDERMADLVVQNILERAWPYNGPEPGIQPLVDSYCDELIAPFKGRWK